MLAQVKDYNQHNNIGVNRERECSFEVSESQTQDFKDLYIKQRTARFIYYLIDEPKDHSDREEKERIHSYTLKYNGHEYRLPPFCKAKLKANYT